MKLIGHFGPIRPRFSFKPLFLFSASALLVFVTYRPYSNDSSFPFENGAIAPYHLTKEECRPVRKIAFMKTHKCASSTIENILFRFALKENLNLALPLKFNYLSRTELFNRSAVLNTPWGSLPVDIFTLHNRWNIEEVRALMGVSTFTFSIVRNPVDQFESLYNYMGLNKTYHLRLKDYISLLKTNQSIIDNLPRGGRGRFGRNQIAFDWGISPSLFNASKQSIQKIIKKLDEQFEIVLIAERMEESLVLLAERLCWPLEYLIHLDLNIRKPERTYKLNEEERSILGRWLNFDTDLYEYFVRRFDEHVAQYNAAGSPNRMEEQVRLFRQLNKQLHKRCVIERVGNEKLHGKFVETHNGVFGYVVPSEKLECHPYAMSEPAFLKLFREKMTERAKPALKVKEWILANQAV